MSFCNLSNLFGVVIMMSSKTIHFLILNLSYYLDSNINNNKLLLQTSSSELKMK